MTHLGEAIARYHQILEQDPDRNTGWMKHLREQFESRGLVVNGRPVTTVLRPHFLSRRQYSNLAQTAEALNRSIERVRKLALADPRLMARMEMLPAEKMLAALDPGYSMPAVASLLDTHVNNGSVHFHAAQTDMPHGIVFSELLSDLFYDVPPVKELRKKFKLAKPGGSKPLIAAMLKAWKEFGGQSAPNVAILEFRQPFASFDSREFSLLVDLFKKQGLEAEVVAPEQLEYRNGVLMSGNFRIDVVYRGVHAHEFLLRYDLMHPLVRAYRERKVCVVNSFRAELTRKKALLALLTDETINAAFPAAERAAIEAAIPCTRLVAQTRTTWKGQPVDLIEHIVRHRADLVLHPNEESAELHSTEGRNVDQATWERALKQALRYPFVVQERVAPHPIQFPVDFYGDMVYRDLFVEVTPHSFLGKTGGCSSRISAPGGAYSTINGLAPTFILETE